MKEVTASTFQKEVLSSKKPVIVDYYADWCGPCKAVAPIVEKVAKDLGHKLVKVNVDNEPELAQQAGVMSIPNLQLVVDGKVTATIVGAQPYPQLIKGLTSKNES